MPFPSRKATSSSPAIPWLLPSSAAFVVVLACGGLEAIPPPAGDGGLPTHDGAASSTLDAGLDASRAPTADGPAGAPQDATATADVSAQDARPVDCTPLPTVLSSSVYMPQEIAVDVNNVYFSGLDDTTEADAIYQIPKGVPGATPLQLSNPDGQPYSLASDGTYLYWNDTLDPGSIRRVGAGGAGETTLLLVDVWGVALSPTSLFWATSNGSAQSMPKGGGAVTTLGMASDSNPDDEFVAVALDTTSFYFVATSALGATLFGVPVSGGPVTTLATVDADVTALTLDTQYLYFVVDDALTRIPLAGGATSVVAQGFAGTIALKVDSGNVYATIDKGNAPTGSVVRVPVTGGMPTVLASSQWDPYGLAVDGNCVYWADVESANGPGAIMMVAK